MGFRHWDRRGRLKADTSGLIGPGPSPHYGVFYKLTPPIKRQFSSESTGTLTQADHGLVVTAPVSATTPNLRIWDRPLYTRPWRVNVLLCPHLYPEGAVHHCGILLRETSTGRLHSISIWDDYTVTVSRWNSPTSFNSNDVAATSFPGITGHPRILSIVEDADHFYSFMLGDGFNGWHSLYSVGEATWLTANRVGFYLNNGSVSVAEIVNILSWERTVP